MAHHAAFPHLFQPLADQGILVSLQFDIVGDSLVDEMAAWTVLHGGQRIKRVNLFGDGTEADSFLAAAHNAGNIANIIPYYDCTIRDAPHPRRRLEVQLHDFSGGDRADLVFDANGNLYGMASQRRTGSGCRGGCGVVFEITP